LRDVVLDGEEIARAQVEGVALVPEHLPRRRVGEAGVDAHRLPRRWTLPSTGSGRRAAADARQVGHWSRYCSDDWRAITAMPSKRVSEGELGGETLGEIGLFRIARQRLERQHRDHRRPVPRPGRDLGPSPRSRPRRCSRPNAGT
jgi:hypothetical protein